MIKPHVYVISKVFVSGKIFMNKAFIYICNC